VRQKNAKGTARKPGKATAFLTGLRRGQEKKRKPREFRKGKKQKSVGNQKNG